MFYSLLSVCADDCYTKVNFKDKEKHTLSGALPPRWSLDEYYS